MINPIRLLYVEDDSSDAEIVLREISKSDLTFKHLIVDTKEDYIEALVSFIPDIIISDYFMPHFDGMNALSLRNEITIHTPFIFVTGSTSEELAVECMKAGANDYILKGNLEKLNSSIKSSLSNRNAMLLKHEIELLSHLDEKLKTAKQLVLKKSDELLANNNGYKTQAFKEGKLTFLDMVIESIGIGTWVYKFSENISFFNTKACQLFGFEHNEGGLTQEEFIEHCHPKDRHKLISLFESAAKNKTEIVTNFRVIFPDGTIKFLETKVKTIINNQGNPERLYGMVWDTTDQQLLLVALHESIRKTNSIINNLNGAVFRCKYDEQLTTEYISEGILELSGFPASDFLLNRVRSFVSLVISEDKVRVLKIINEAVIAKKSFVTEFRITSEKGEIIWIWVRGRGVFTSNKAVAIEGFITDITERKNAEDELKSSLDQLHELTKYIEKVREDERIAISRELHDDLGQSLTAIKIDLGNIKQTVSDSNTVIKINKVIGIVGETIKSVQRLTSQLRPPLINDLGLEAAIEWYANDFSLRTKIDISFDIDQGLSISTDASLVIFRIMQESLTNIARHSKATHVSIALSKTNESIILMVSDNGIGISDEKLKSKKSFGIISMKERARSLGGTLNLYRDSNNFTVIKLVVPINS
jgi:PAS domain S-box-containing protein